MARVGPPGDRVFPVEFVASPPAPAVREDIRTELDLYLLELGEPDPWR